MFILPRYILILINSSRYLSDTIQSLVSVAIEFVSLVCSWRATAVDISYRRRDQLFITGPTHSVGQSLDIRLPTVIGQQLEITGIYRVF